jgi:hypothetical protein
METQEQIKSFIYDKLIERETVLRETNEVVEKISDAANMEVDKINTEIQTAQELLSKFSEPEEDK